MKYIFSIILLGLYPLFLPAQPSEPGVAERHLVLKLAFQCLHYSTVNFDSAKYYGVRALNLADKIDFTSGEIIARTYLGIAYTRSGDIPESLPLQFEGLQIAKDNHLPEEEALCLYAIGKSYFFLRDNTSAMRFFREAYNGLKTYDVDNEIQTFSSAFSDIKLSLGRLYLVNGKIDSALYYFQLLEKEKSGSFAIGVLKVFLGEAYFVGGKRDLGLAYLRESVNEGKQQQDNYNIAWACSILAGCYREMNNTDSAINYARVGLAAAQKINFKDRMLQLNQLLADVYEGIDIKESHNYLKKAVELNDELFGADRIFKLQKAVAEQQQVIQEAEKKRLAYESNIRQYSLILGIAVVLIITLLLYRNNRQKQTANKVLESAYANLKSTQSQLIQAEKMASLGELTAGIAHEIQNPLNFVNNFSEVNAELIDEQRAELNNGNMNEAKILANEIAENEKKIIYHGKRADAIVKGMLAHSRSSSAQKVLTDINALAQEYLRLSWHGLKAKDPSFNASFHFEPYESLPKVNVVQQDIGRVLLNLINNAFQAVSGYGDKPMVRVSTRQREKFVEIKVADNGPGITDAIKDKIFQPFFTTKPTGQGTGLGLSLSYDIIKAHGGDIALNTKVLEGAEFIIQLPIS